MLMSVLALNPSYGDQIPSFNTLRKMRIAVPEHKMGKSSGYRLIYAERVIEQTHRIVLLEVYFKGDVEDLAKAEYYTLGAEAEEIFGSVFEYDWVDGPAVPPIPK